MSDLISRQNALDALKEYEVVESDNFTRTDPITMMTIGTIANCIETIWELPSVESERMAKVSNQIFYNSNPYTVGAWIGTCECGGLVSYSSKYCHMCGARLEWNE